MNFSALRFLRSKKCGFYGQGLLSSERTACLYLLVAARVFGHGHTHDTTPPIPRFLFTFLPSSPLPFPFMRGSGCPQNLHCCIAEFKRAFSDHEIKFFGLSICIVVRKCSVRTCTMCFGDVSATVVSRLGFRLQNACVLRATSVCVCECGPDPWWTSEESTVFARKVIGDNNDI